MSTKQYPPGQPKAPVAPELVHDAWSLRQAALATSEYGKWLRPLPTL